MTHPANVCAFDQSDISSANWPILAPSATLGMSLTRIMYSRGLRQDPCGVPASIVTLSDVFSPTFTFNFRSRRNELMSLIRRFGMPSLLTLLRMASCHA